MSQFVVKLPPLLIPNGFSASNIWKKDEVYEDASTIILYAPAIITDPNLTFVLQVTQDPEASIIIFDTFQLGDLPSDANLPLAGKARAYTTISSAGGIRIMASGIVTGDTAWQGTKTSQAQSTGVF